MQGTLNLLLHRLQFRTTGATRLRLLSVHLVTLTPNPPIASFPVIFTRIYLQKITNSHLNASLHLRFVGFKPEIHLWELYLIKLEVNTSTHCCFDICNHLNDVVFVVSWKMKMLFISFSIWLSNWLCLYWAEWWSRMRSMMSIGRWVGVGVSGPWWSL